MYMYIVYMKIIKKKNPRYTNNLQSLVSSLITSSTVYNYKWIKHKFLLLQTVTLDIQLPEESEKAEIETLPHEEKLTAIINVLSQALKEGKSGQWIQKWKNTSNEYYCPLQWMLWCFLKTISWMYMYKLCESNLFLCMNPDVLKVCLPWRICCWVLWICWG